MIKLDQITEGKEEAVTLPAAAMILSKFSSSATASWNLPEISAILQASRRDERMREQSKESSHFRKRRDRMSKEGDRNGRIYTSLIERRQFTALYCSTSGFIVSKAGCLTSLDPINIRL